MFQCKKIVFNGSDVVFTESFVVLFYRYNIVLGLNNNLDVLYIFFFSFFYFSVCTLLCATAVKLGYIYN